MEPLAHRLRPTKLSDVIGQEYLTGKDGIITKMIENNHLQSFVLYGGPGTGKTTIGKIIKEMYSLESYEFNASSDSKAILQEITNLTKFYPNVILIIDEIHRMKKDTQDYLLPYLEDGRITLLTGPRAIGKYTLLYNAFINKGYSYVSLDDSLELSVAIIDPKIFLEMHLLPL